MRQRPELLAGGEAVGNHVGAVDLGRAGVRLDHRVQHAERRRFTGAVRPEEPGDLAVRRLETDALNGLHVTEGLVDVADTDHGAGAEKLRKNGITKLSLMQSAAPSSSFAAATKPATTSGVQPTVIWP